MNCPWMQGNRIKECAAVSSPVVLSGGELEAFCRGGDYHTCPVFQAVEEQGGEKIEIRQYCLIYDRWARTPARPAAAAGGL